MTAQEYAPALWIPTSHFGFGQGVTGQNTKKWIIVHGTASGGSAQDIAHYFQTNNPPTSVHYVVGQDGTVVQCVHENDAAWGNGVVTQGHAPWWNPNRNPNLDTISIEHVKPDPQNATPLTPAQQAASFKLIEYLCQKHNIPRRAADTNGGITGHFSIDPVNRRLCPNVYPWGALWASLNNAPQEGKMLDISQVSSWFVQLDDTHWKCKENGNVIALGMLNAYRSAPAMGNLQGLTAYGLPLTNEYSAPNHPDVTIQVFERGVLIYDPHRIFDSPPGATGDVYVGHWGVTAPAPVPNPIDKSAFQAIIASLTNETNTLNQLVSKL